MLRTITQKLLQWKQRSQRKPLLIKGARQVGKTFLVRQLGKEFDSFLEINFEKEKNAHFLFNENLDPKEIIKKIAILKNVDILPGRTLLFFDEIQECENAIKSLRYFYEESPEYHVIAAGSLLEFTLEKIGFSVGRLETLHLYPMSLQEFLISGGHQNLVDLISNHNSWSPLNEAIHLKLLNLFFEYMAIGGMPEVCQHWHENRDLRRCQALQLDLVESYRQDFEKYAKKHEIKYVETVFNAIPRNLTQKFIFSKVSSHFRSRELQPALQLLHKANIAHSFFHCSSNGIPLGAEQNDRIFKCILSDVALTQVFLGNHVQKEWLLDGLGSLINKGPIVEAFVGQELVAYSMPQKKAQCYYWTREKKGSLAEIDYVFSENANINLLEVKSGNSNKLSSLRLFLNEKQNNGQNYKAYKISPQNFGGDASVKFVPLYAVNLLFANQ